MKLKKPDQEITNITERELLLFYAAYSEGLLDALSNLDHALEAGKAITTVMDSTPHDRLGTLVEVLKAWTTKVKELAEAHKLHQMDIIHHFDPTLHKFTYGLKIEHDPDDYGPFQMHLINIKETDHVDH